MGLIEIVLTIAIAGAIIWLISQIPMPPAFQKAIYVIAFVFLVLYILQAFGWLPHFHDVRLR